MTALTTSVSLRLPVGWIELDPRCPDLVSELQRAVRERWQHVLNEDLSRLLGPLVVELRRLAATSDVVLVGLFCRVIPIDGEELPLVLTANVALAVSPAGVGLDVVAGEVAGDGWEVRPIELPSGPAVLVAGDIEIADPDWDSPVPAKVRRYFIPIPGLPRLALLNFLTPNLDVAEALADVFDAVAETVTFE